MANSVVVMEFKVHEGSLEEAFAKIEARALLCAERVKATLADVPGAKDVDLNIVVPVGAEKVQ